MILSLQEAQEILGDIPLNKDQIEELIRDLEVIASHVIDSQIKEVKRDDKKSL